MMPVWVRHHTFVMQQVNVRLPEDIFAALKQEAQRSGNRVSVVVRIAIDRWLSREPMHNSPTKHIRSKLRSSAMLADNSSGAVAGTELKKPQPCSSPDLDEHCSGCNDPRSEGTHAGCTIEHSHVGCDEALKLSVGGTAEEN